MKHCHVDICFLAGGGGKAFEESGLVRAGYPSRLIRSEIMAGVRLKGNGHFFHAGFFTTGEGGPYSWAQLSFSLGFL